MRKLSFPAAPIVTFIVAAAIFGLISTAILGVTAAKAADELTASPLIVLPIADIRPVDSADGAIHLVYELLLVNQSAFAVTLKSLAVIDENDEAIAQLSGNDLVAISRLSLVAGGAEVLQPSQSSFVFLDVTLPIGTELPEKLRHRLVIGQSAPLEGGNIELGGLTVAPETGTVPGVTFTSAGVAVSDDVAVVLTPPVRGDGWLVFRGCCDVATSHRGNTGIYNGNLHIAERFAIDFARLDDGGRMIVGPGNEVASYVYYGEPIFAVGDGIVIGARNDEPAQIPGTLPANLSDDQAGGNAVVIDLGNSRFAFYAHMQAGSVRVRAGDPVKAGDVIGLLGNSGRSIGPHLHFHLSDSASPLEADGVPFVFESFNGQGVMTPEGFGLAMQGEVVPVDATMLAGPHRLAMPVNSQVVDFGN